MGCPKGGKGFKSLEVGEDREGPSLRRQGLDRTSLPQGDVRKKDIKIGGRIEEDHWLPLGNGSCRKTKGRKGKRVFLSQG